MGSHITEHAHSRARLIFVFSGVMLANFLYLTFNPLEYILTFGIKKGVTFTFSKLIFPCITFSLDSIKITPVDKLKKIT